MIEITLKDWEENDLKNRIVGKCTERIIASEFKLYGDIPEEGCYTPYDKFKNFIANLVADRIFQYMVGNEEVKARIDNAIEKATDTIVAQYMKNLRESED